jgi:hypothetical protein
MGMYQREMYGLDVVPGSGPGPTWEQFTTIMLAAALSWIFMIYLARQEDSK